MFEGRMDCQKALCSFLQDASRAAIRTVASLSHSIASSSRATEKRLSVITILPRNCGQKEIGSSHITRPPSSLKAAVSSKAAKKTTLKDAQPQRCQPSHSNPQSRHAAESTFSPLEFRPLTTGGRAKTKTPASEHLDRR